MAKIKVNEAIAQAMVNGKKVWKKQLAAKLWPNSSELTQMANMTNLCAGKTKMIPAEWVQIICDETGCDANFLFDIKTEQL